MRNESLEAGEAPPPAAGRRARSEAEAGLEDYVAGTASAARLHAAAQADRRLADRLLALRRSERRPAVAGDRRYHRPGLATLFALQAEEALLADPGADPEPAAELAAAVAVQLPRDAGGKARRTAALAHWLLGKSLLRTGSWQRAEEALRTMYAYIPDDARWSAERGLAAYGMAQLDAALERHDAAIGLSTLAAQQFTGLRIALPAAACQAQAALLAQESGDVEHAAIGLRKALRLLGRYPLEAPSLAARLGLALAAAEATMGNGGEAGEQLRRARRLYRLAPSPRERVARDWGEAKAAAAAGRMGDAEPRMERVRRELLAAGSPAEAVGATLDQVEMRLATGRAETVDELTAALAGAFPGEGGAWEKELGGLGSLAGAAPQELRAATAELRRRLRHALPAGPWRPALIVPWRLLTDRLVRGHGEGSSERSPG